MKYVIQYSMRDFLRSQKYFPPLSTFILLMVVFYSYKPNPVIDSYAVTSLMMYVISAWLCTSFLALDSPVQRQLMILHAGGKNHYYIGKFMAIAITSTIFTLFAFMYPIIFGMFQENVSLSVGFISLMNHFMLSLLGIGVASLFSRIFMNSTVNSYGGLALTITISFTTIGLYEVLPTMFKNLVWVIPPAIMTQKPLMNWNGQTLSNIEWFPFVWILIYASLLISIFFILVKRKS
ncbi:hypothetical protein [Ornithinibacillus scapharcae]|uniref:hypothetical protein n=1 Tax=Ornithinibacillus scapharcae TaxID=1147159 RepID=UPI000225AA76|nr:hypothetical protein [Ornithinibacillus scapharcae]